MPYSPTITWATGDTLNAGDLNTNLQGISKYLSTGIATASELTDDMVDATKILRPRNILVSEYCVSQLSESGSIHHIRFPALDYHAKSPMTNIPYQTAGFVTSAYSDVTIGTGGYRPITGSYVTFYAIEAPAAVVIRYMGEIIVPYDQVTTGRNNIVACAYEGTVALESISRIPSPYNTVTSLEEENQGRRHVAGCAIVTSGLTAGWHSAGLVAGFSSNYGLLGGFEITVEVFY
jgi:hypothetical protein